MLNPITIQNSKIRNFNRYHYLNGMATFLWEHLNSPSRLTGFPHPVNLSKCLTLLNIRQAEIKPYKELSEPERYVYRALRRKHIKGYQQDIILSMPESNYGIFKIDRESIIN